MKDEKKKRRFTAIDYFIVFAVVAILLASGLRLYSNFKPEDTGMETADTEYIVSFVSKGMRLSTADLLKKGDEFYMSGGETVFGVLEDNPTLSLSKTRVELVNGALKTDEYAEDNGDNTKRDVEGQFRVKGCRNSEDGLMYVEGLMYIAPNMPVTVLKGDMTFSFTVTDIKEAS